MTDHPMLPELAAFLAWKTASGVKPRTLYWYQQRIAPMLADLGPLPTQEEVLPWLLVWKEQRKASKGHYHNQITAVRGYLKYHGIELDIPPIPPELTEFLAYKAAQGLRPHTVKSYKSRLRPVLAQLGPRPSLAKAQQYLVAWKARAEIREGRYVGVCQTVGMYLRYCDGERKTPKHDHPMLPELAAYIAHKEAAGCRPRTIESYTERLAPILAELGALPTTETVLPWMVAWAKRKNLGATTRRGALIVLRNYLQFHNIKLDIPMPRPPRYEGPRLVPAQVTQLLAAVQGDGTHPTPYNRHARCRDYAMILLLLDTGIRVGELSRLSWGDFDFAQTRFTVDGKGGHQRIAYFGEATKAALLKWRKSHPGHTEFLFCAVRGHLYKKGGRRDYTRALQRSAIWCILRRYGKEAGIQQICPHALRRTFATEWIKAGGNILVLQRLMGHNDLKMLQRYVILAETDLALEAGHRGVMDKLLA